MAISRWEPGRGALSLSDAVRQLFDESIWFPMGAGQQGFGLQVPLDVYQEGDRYIVEAPLPGLKAEDVQIQMVGTTLTISAEGPDEIDAVQSLIALVESGFGEESWNG